MAANIKSHLLYNSDVESPLQESEELFIKFVTCEMSWVPGLHAIFKRLDLTLPI